MFFEKTVVVPSAASDTVSFAIEDHAGNEDKVNLAGVSRCLRFGYMGIAWLETRFARIRADFHRFAVRYGQEHRFAVVVFVEQRTQVHLVMNRIVEQYGAGVAEDGRLFNLPDNSLGVGGGLLGGIDTSLLLYDST